MFLKYGLSLSNTSHPYYKKTPGITKSIYDFFIFWLSAKLLLLHNVLSDYKNKINKSLYDIKASNYYFIIYYLHYKDKIILNLTRTILYATSYFYF